MSGLEATAHIISSSLPTLLIPTGFTQSDRCPASLERDHCNNMFGLVRTGLGKLKAWVSGEAGDYESTYDWEEAHAKYLSFLTPGPFQRTRRRTRRRSRRRSRRSSRRTSPRKSSRASSRSGPTRASTLRRPLSPRGPRRRIPGPTGAICYEISAEQLGPKHDTQCLRWIAVSPADR